VQQGVLATSTPLSATSLTGFSGGGKKLIARYEHPQDARNNLSAPQPYALGQRHKHAPEMKHWSGLAQPPVFLPVVSCYFQGMTVSVPIARSQLAKRMTARDLAAFYGEFYADEACIRVVPYGDDSLLDEGFLDPTGCNGTNRADIFVTGHDDQALVTVRIDNLGKGASGAAIQCMNILCGLPELTSLTV
jgi:N-acetyl-gamma-glutamyl-phosphate reductase